MSTTKRKRLTPQDKAEIIRKLQANYANMSVIGREHGVSRAYIRDIAYKNGITHYTQAERVARSPAHELRRNREQRSAGRAARVVELSEAWIAGKTCLEISQQFGYTGGQVQVASLVARLRQNHGIEKFPYRRIPE